MRFLAAFLVGLALAGCAPIAAPSARMMPLPTATTYLAPDGREWVLHQVDRPNEGRYAGGYIIKFTPTKVEAHEETEVLSFGYLAENFSVVELRRRFRFMKDQPAPDLLWTVDGTATDSFYNVYSPSHKERAIQRSVQRGTAYCFVGYSTFRGAVGAKSLNFWEAVLRKWPLESLQPAPAETAAH